MKYADYMRLGAEHTGWCSILKVNKGLDKHRTCALGAAHYGWLMNQGYDHSEIPSAIKGHDFLKEIKVDNDHLPEKLKEGKPMSLREVIWTLNDTLHWPRKAIAEYLDYLESYCGYEIEFGAEEDPQTKEQSTTTPLPA